MADADCDHKTTYKILRKNKSSGKAGHEFMCGGMKKVHADELAKYWNESNLLFRYTVRTE